MDEQQWLDCADPVSMLNYLFEGAVSCEVICGGNSNGLDYLSFTAGVAVSPHASNRKLRLFCCACARRVWRVFSREECRNAIKGAERYAEGEIAADELLELLVSVGGIRPSRDGGDTPTLPCCAWEVARATTHFDLTAWIPLLVHSAQEAVRKLKRRTAAGEAERRAQADLLREVVGNPFRLISVDPAWLIPAVLPLATAAYDNRILPAGTLDPERLVVLADALEDAGCSDVGILRHLRGPEPHVHGCWALDALLAKK